MNLRKDHYRKFLIDESGVVVFSLFFQGLRLIARSRAEGVKHSYSGFQFTHSGVSTFFILLWEDGFVPLPEVKTQTIFFFFFSILQSKTNTKKQNIQNFQQRISWFSHR